MNSEVLFMDECFTWLPWMSRDSITASIFLRIFYYLLLHISFSFVSIGWNKNYIIILSFSISSRFQTQKTFDEYFSLFPEWPQTKQEPFFLPRPILTLVSCLTGAKHLSFLRYNFLFSFYLVSVILFVWTSFKIKFILQKKAHFISREYFNFFFTAIPSEDIAIFIHSQYFWNELINQLMNTSINQSSVFLHWGAEFWYSIY